MPLEGPLEKDNTDMNTPVYSTLKSAGADLKSTIDTWINPGERLLIPTGVFGPDIFDDDKHHGQVVPRSGLAVKHGITVLNAPGIIDSDYTGEIKVILINHGNKAVRIYPGDRIAQLILVKHTININFDVSENTRTGGFGSTGKGE